MNCALIVELWYCVVELWWIHGLMMLLLLWYVVVVVELYMGVPFYEVVVLRVLMKMGHSWWIVILDKLSEMLVWLCWYKFNELLILVIRLGCEKFWEETWVFVWRASKVILENNWFLHSLILSKSWSNFTNHEAILTATTNFCIVWCCQNHEVTV